MPCSDPQEWDPWRSLVVETAARVLDYIGGTLIIPQSMLVRQFWNEISSGLDDRGIPIEHFVLHADEHTLIQRIENGPAMPASQWRLDHIKTYRQALPWLCSHGKIIETDRLTPD